LAASPTAAPYFGLRRSPYLLLGLLISSVALVPLHAVATAASGGSVAMTAGLFVVMIVFGVGFGLTGDSHNALIAELTAGKKNRSTVIAIVWLFQIFGSIVAAIIVSIILQVADQNAGAAKACLTDACALIRRNVALSMMSTFFAVGPILAVIGWLPLLGLEPRLSGAQAMSVEQRPALHLRQAYTRIFSNSQARTFFFFVFVSIFALFVQDDILEPFGAKVFGLLVSATSQFQPIMGGVTLLGMLVMGFIAGSRPIPKRAITNFGATLSALGLVLLGWQLLCMCCRLCTPAWPHWAWAWACSTSVRCP